MLNQVQQGDAIDIVAPAAGTVSGNPCLVGAALFGVAGITATVGQPSVLWRKGVFTLPKISAQAWAIGDVLYWSPNNSAVTNVNSSSDIKVGIAAAVAANPSTKGVVILTGQC